MSGDLPTALPVDFSVVIKPSGPDCNIACGYCYYLSKSALYPGTRTRMPDATLDRLVSATFEARAGAPVDFIWQGGEPTLMTLSFFRKVMKTIERHRARGQPVSHSIQTNGILLDDQWCSFLKEHDFLVGLSMDGPQHIHDGYRVDKAGGGTHALVRRGWERLARHKVDTNILCTVHRGNEQAGLEVYRHFRDDLGATWMQFIPVVERLAPGPGDGEQAAAGGVVSDHSVTPEGYGKFLCEIYDEWVASDVGTIHVQTFEAMLGSLFGHHLICVHAPTCGNALALEHNGDAYVCDHYVEPAYRLGNLDTSSLRDLAGSEVARRFGAGKRDTLPDNCRTCAFRHYCHGGCPKDRFAAAQNGDKTLNYLCEGYRMFFSHADRSMRRIAALVRSGRPASDVMSA